MNPVRSTLAPRSGIARRARRAGFSLVELMVALALGATVTLGIITMFSGTQESGAVLQGQARIQDNARYAIDFVSRSLRMAGFLGCVSRSDAMRTSLSGDFANVPFTSAIQTMVQGYEGGTAAAHTWSPALTTLPTTGGGAIPIADITAGTDVLVVRQVADGSRVTVGQTSSAAPLTVLAPADPSLFAAGRFAVVSDCTKGTLFQVTGSAAAGGNLVVQHATGGTTVPGNAVATLPGFNEDSAVYGTDASVYRVQTTVYYVAPGAGTNNRGATPLSLWRKVDDAAPVELIEGVRDMQVLFGIDSDGDGVPNRYVNGNLVTTPDDVVSVRVRFTTDSVDEVPGGGGVASRAFEATIAVRNRLS